MDKVVQQNAANAEESASASEELNAQAEQLRDYVGELMMMVTGNRTSSKGTVRGDLEQRHGATHHSSMKSAHNQYVLDHKSSGVGSGGGKMLTHKSKHHDDEDDDFSDF